MGTECALCVSASSHDFGGNVQRTGLCANVGGLSEKGKASVVV